MAQRTGRRVHLRDPEGTLAVSDSGPGIAAEDLPHVFDRFYRAAAARSMPGSGLGLAIARGIVEAHQGRMWVESEVGRGSRFCFAIPAIANVRAAVRIPAAGDKSDSVPPRPPAPAASQRS